VGLPTSSGSVSVGEPNVFEVSSKILGDTAGSTNSTINLFNSTLDSIVMQNTLGAVLDSTGVISLPAGLYRIESDGYFSDPSVNLSGNDIIYSVVGPNGTIAPAQVNDTPVIGGVYTVECTGVYMWPTSVYGATVTIQATVTYASGTTTIWGYLKITQLGASYLMGDGVLHRPKVQGLVSPSITITDEEYISVSPQTAAISISSAKRDILLSSDDFSD